MFNDWLLSQLEERGWSQADLARSANITRAAVSRYMQGRTPNEEALRKIARAFRLPPEDVFRQAGILPPVTVEDAQLKELAYLATQLPDQELDDLIEYARHRLSLAEKRGNYESKKN